MDVVLSQEEKRSDWCPVAKSRVYSYYDYSSWGDQHPRCERCGYLDESRIIESTAGKR